MKKTNSETRAELLGRIRRQKQTIKELIKERDGLRIRLDGMAVYQTTVAQLQRQLRIVSERTGLAPLADAVRTLRKAIRDDSGEFVGGASRRRILADADDFALHALNSANTTTQER